MRPVAAGAFSAAGGKLEWLEVMRGVAALWVLLHHAVLATSHFLGPLSGSLVLGNGYLGVDFFFVLSGFIIACSATRLSESGGGIGAYFQARLARIYVPYLPIGIGIYLLYLLLPGLSEGGRSPGLLTSFTLLPSNAPPALSVAWTLVHEMLFYMIFSVWFVSQRLFWAFMALWAGTIAGMHVGQLEVDRFTGYFVSPLNLCFLVGVVLFTVMNRIQPSVMLAKAAAIAGIVIIAVQANSEDPARTWVTLGFALLVIAAASPFGQSYRAWRGFLTLGAASYAIYLVHNPVLAVAVRVVRATVPEMTPWAGLGVISLVALLAGLAYWRFYERAALRVTRQWIGARAPVSLAMKPGP